MQPTPILKTIINGIECEDSEWTSVDKDKNELPARLLSDLDTDHLANILRTQFHAFGLISRIAKIMHARGVTKREFVGIVNHLHSEWIPINRDIPNRTHWDHVDQALNHL